tara:strand:+ start:687 stop:1259 length:573 start_codon:yes stop_codon:yes gene_type:complete
MEMLGLDNKKLKEKGTTLLEALVATAIVGIGFIAVFQMVNFSLQSIDVSSERTKIGYLSDMVAEDLLAYKNSTKSDVKFKDALLTTRDATTASSWNLSGCNDGAGINNSATNAEDKSFDKWNNRFSKRRIKCRGTSDSKDLKTYTICKTGCLNTYNDSSGAGGNIFDALFLGKVEVITGEKTKYLYFRID